MILDSGGPSPGVDTTFVPSSAPQRQRITLHIGVLDQLYRSRSKGVVPMSTGDVAQILEAKYGLFSAFYKDHQEAIDQYMVESMRGALEAYLMGHAIDPFGSATQGIARMFRNFISTRESERVGIPGTPTKAALRGVNHRLAHPYRKTNARRPSFRDTGLLMASARAWVTAS